MRAADLVVVTGSQNNVRNAYSSGKPAIGVGAGNVPVIIDARRRLRRRGSKDLRLQDFRQLDILFVGKLGHHRR